MKQNATAYKVKSVLKLLSLPIAVFLIMHVINLLVSGTGLISSSTDLRSLLRTILTTFAFAMAINCNLRTGRMDLSLGSQMFLACIFGGNIALSLGLGGVGVLVLSMVFGLVCGFIVGVLYVNLRILPMIFGIGMSLIFECISFGAYNQQGLMLYGKPGVAILSNMSFVITVAVLLLLVMTFLFQYSSFGYKGRAVQGSQKLAKDAGVNVYVNCVISYTLAGMLAACAGVFDTAFKGTMTPVLDMGSNSMFFGSMFPMFVGVWLGSFVGNPVLGVLCGALSMRFLTLGLAKLSLEGAIQNIIIFSLFLIFMILRDNMSKFSYMKRKRERIQLAKTTAIKMQAAVGENASNMAAAAAIK